MAKRKADSTDTSFQPVAKKPAVEGTIINNKTLDSSTNNTVNKNNNKLVTSILKPSNSDSPKSSPSSRRVSFPPPVELGDTLRALEDGTLDTTEGGLETIIGQLESLRGNSLVLWLQELQNHIMVLGKSLSSSSSAPDAMHGLVLEILKLSWADQEPSVVEAYKGFLVNLVSANTCYTRATIGALLNNYKPNVENKEKDSRIFRHTHDVIEGLLEVSPVGAKEELLSQLNFKFPYHKFPAYKQICYVSALLQMTTYAADSTDQILAIILEKMVKLDAHLSRETLENFYEKDDEDDENNRDSELVNLTTALDLMMKLVFAFITENTKSLENEVSSASLINSLMKVYHSHILPSYNIVHTQFLYFHLCSISPIILNRFLSDNWKIFTNPNTPSILRQTSMSYISSLLSRLSTVSISTVLTYLEKISTWAHSYIRARETTATVCLDFMYTDLACHGAFYSACQAVFYLFAFKHHELMTSSKRVKVLKSFSWHSLVTSHLNPLRVCLPAVVENFSRVARHYQLAYCTAITERNNRINLPVVGSLSSAGSSKSAKPLLLDCFFPFDPYILEGSRDLVDQFYLHYRQDTIPKEEKDDSIIDDGDENDLKRLRQDSIRSNTSGRSRTDSVGCLTELLLQDLPIT